uniref:HMG box domain-containing protein n=2 Tax=Araucariaceae TaxID=25664 RepID=A0A0D6R7A3_ARACU
MKDAKAKKASAVEAKDRKAETKKKLHIVKEKPKKRPAKPKTKKDPNQPKRPPTAFFVYLEEFRKTFKEKNPNVKGVAAVGKACGDKWKEMSDAEKAPYLAKAAQKKAEYDVSMTAYKKKQEGGDEGETPEGSDKSKSELNEDDEEDDSEEDDD